MFAKRIKEVRLSMNMTSVRFADFLGLSRGIISMYERGKTTPSLKGLANIAKKCDVSIDYLCGLTDMKKTEISDYRDIAERILELVDCQDSKAIRKGKDGLFISIPQGKELETFIENYWNLLRLEEQGKITHDIIQNWKDGALKELEKIGYTKETL
jgi:transcriptional regulator with XRE-family HTH domain